MKPVTANIATAIERLKSNGTDFETFMEWIQFSYAERVSETLRMDRDNVQIGQGYSLALDEILNAVGKSRETLDRANKNQRDTR